MKKLACLCLVSGLLSGCTLSKTENPLSPAVAGPIPGVNITAPNPLEPRDGFRIFSDQQPITLTMLNASSSGVRPITYRVEVASDAGFANKLETFERVPAGTADRTSLKLTQVLTSGRSYYWRAKAQDGANEGPFSAAATFEIVTPVVFEAPGLVGPHHTGTLTSMTPVFTWHNAARTGTPNGTVVYELQVSETSAFATNLGTSVNEAPAAQTSVTVSEGLKASTQYFWRVRARDSIVTGPWSGVAIFTTPFAGGGSGGGGGGGGGAGPVNNACHVGPGPLSRDRANAIVLGCAEEFPHLIAVFSTEDEAVAKAEELLLRTIWHLQLAGFNAARQRNPSQAISKDKLSLLLDGVWHAYDIFTLGYAGVATRVGGMLEVPLPNPVPDPGIPD